MQANVPSLRIDGRTPAHDEHTVDALLRIVLQESHAIAGYRACGRAEAALVAAVNLSNAAAMLLEQCKEVVK